MRLNMNVAFLLVCLISLVRSSSIEKRAKVEYPPEGEFLFPDAFDELKKNEFRKKPEMNTSINIEGGLPLELAFILDEAGNDDEIIGNILSNRDDYFEELGRGESTLLMSRFGGSSSSKANVPPSAHCQPENAVVKVAPETEEFDIIYYPVCIRVPRCSGCCNNEKLQCEAVEKVEKTYQIRKLRYENRYKFVKFEDVKVEEHTKCQCNCIIKEKDCNIELQNYDSRSCRCDCKNEDERYRCDQTRDRYWNSETCSCDCSDVDDCTTGFTFNHSICDCLQD